MDLAGQGSAWLVGELAERPLHAPEEGSEIEDYGLQLRLDRHLHTFREGLRDRPVVFVGYSLGGLVIQHVSSETFSLRPPLTVSFLLQIGSLVCKSQKRITIPSPTNLWLHSARNALQRHENALGS